jgi:hypothetical protein
MWGTYTCDPPSKRVRVMVGNMWEEGERAGRGGSMINGMWGAPGQANWP